MTIPPSSLPSASFRLIRLSYFSTACVGLDSRELEAIMQVSAERNRARSVTGVLLYNGRNFLQVLEGPQEPVEDLYHSIMCDERHFGVTTLSEAAIDAYTYPTWGMLLKRLSLEGRRDDFRRMEQEIGGALVDLSPFEVQSVMANFMRLL